MKRLLLIVLPLLLIVVCSKQEPINYETTLIERDGVFYTKDTNKPYSGPVFSLNERGLNKIEGVLENGKLITHKEFKWYENGQKKSEVNYKDGEKDGFWTEWYENGQKGEEYTYKDGKQDGLVTQWYENGQMSYEGTGKPDGLSTYWYENGQKKYEGTFKDWKRDGLFTSWYENGQKWSEVTYKDGKEISKKEWNEDGSVKE
jgi:hypothetical protein